MAREQVNKGSWELERNIGSGGFGVVKLYTNLVSGSKVVIKECRLMSLSQEIIERWYAELDIVKKLDHPNIVKAMDIPWGLNLKTVGDTPCICMEFCDGGDLRQVLRSPENCCGLEEVQIRQICRDITQGIRFLHGRRIIHRDLKPENILLKRIGENQVIYKLTDFGYAKEYDNSSVCTSFVGTVQYVAPEVVRDKKYNSSVDFWSLGVVVFECITGRRPFLHGHPSAAFTWVDFVANKGEEDIHIYFSNDSHDPVHSAHLPHPHRLSRPFENLVTSWLQLALHSQANKRGCRVMETGEAPCLTNMEHILDTMIVNAVCMQTGDVYSFAVNGTNTVEDLKSNIHQCTSVPPSELYLALPDGYIMDNRDLVSCCIREGNVGSVYLFSTALEPSFKMMATTSQSISKLIAYGDESIAKEDRRNVYAHAFFHIREQYHLFERLHKGHKAILTTIHRQCNEIRESEQALSSHYFATDTLTSYIQHMQQMDLERLRSIAEHKGKDPLISQTLASWEQLSHRLQQQIQNLASLGLDLGRLRQEVETLLRLADDLSATRENNEGDFYNYYQQYVITARNVYKEAKSSQGALTEVRMADVLVGAKQQAEKIILERLNGYNFAKQHVAMATLLSVLNRKREDVILLRQNLMQLSEQMRKDTWNLLQHESKPSVLQSLLPSASVHPYENCEPLPLSRTSSSTSDMLPLRSDSTDSDMSEMLERSLKRITKLISVEENEKLEEHNKVLLTRLSSLAETYQQSNGSIVAMESSSDSVFSYNSIHRNMSSPSPLPSGSHHYYYYYCSGSSLNPH